MKPYTESTQTDLGSTQSLYRAIFGLCRVYTEGFGVYIESTQTDQAFTQSLHRPIQGLHRVILQRPDLYRDL